MSSNNVFIHSLEIVYPPHHRYQNELIDWMLMAHLKSYSYLNEGEKRDNLADILRRFCVNEKQIKERYFEAPDIDVELDESPIYKITPDSPAGSSILERNKYFNEAAKRVFEILYPVHSEIPKHLIHVTCTGYISPSAPQVYFSSRECAPKITHAYHMGCYASLPAIRMAEALALKEEGEIDVVHTEMCSLHMNPTLQTPEQMVVQSLFADGHIKYKVSNNIENTKGFKIKIIKEKIIPSSSEDMTWIPAANGMTMTLSKEVPVKIKDHLMAFLREMCEEAEIKLEDVLRSAIFAIHPGGPKIIDAIQKRLELLDAQVSFSHKVLLERGNMSSATLPHVWREILEADPRKGSYIVSFAFGPGLTIFGSIFETVHT